MAVSSRKMSRSSRSSSSSIGIGISISIAISSSTRYARHSGDSVGGVPDVINSVAAASRGTGAAAGAST
eukprot:3735919-Pleurochrysis_carterae.AAC.2